MIILNKTTASKLFQNLTIDEEDIKFLTKQFVLRFTGSDISTEELQEVIKFIFTHPIPQLYYSLVINFIEHMISHNPTNIKEYFDNYLTEKFTDTISFFLEVDLKFFDYYDNLIRNTVNGVQVERFQIIGIYSAVQLKKNQEISR